MQNFVYLFSAYTIISLAILGFVFSMVRKQKRLSREVEMLKEALEARQDALRK